MAGITRKPQPTNVTNNDDLAMPNRTSRWARRSDKSRLHSSKDSSDGGGETSPTLDKLDVYGDGPWTVPT